MSVFDWMNIGKQLSDPIKAASNLYTTDKARIEAETNFEDTVQKPVLEQIENNKIMSMSSILFNSGWQPLVGWTTGFLVLIYYFPQIMIATYVWGSHCIQSGIVTPFPIAPDDILNLVYLLFGFGVHSLIRWKV